MSTGILRMTISPHDRAYFSQAWNHQPPSSFTFVPKNGMTIPARPTLENMFQFPVFCFSEDGSSHFTPNRWNDDPQLQWNTHIFWAGLRRWRKHKKTVYSILFVYHFIWNYPTFSWGTSQQTHVRSLFPKHIPNRTPISKAKKTGHGYIGLPISTNTSNRPFP